MASPVRIGADLGGTRIKALRLEGEHVAERREAATPAGPPEEVLAAVADLVEGLGSPRGSLGLTIPGEVAADGRCVRLPNLRGFEDFPIAAWLRRRLGAEVVVENDGTAAALAERVLGHGRRHPSFLLVTLGTGVGGGLVLDGRLRRGAHGFAGELGHVRVERGEAARACACGGHGCLEAYAGGRALTERALELGLAVDGPLALFRLDATGEPRAQRLVEEAVEALATALTSVQNLLDLDALVFSGGVSAAMDRLEPPLRAAMRRQSFSAILAELPILVSALGPDAPGVGAALLAGLAEERPA